MKSTCTLALLAATSAFLVTSGSLRASETDDRIESSAEKSYVFKTYLKNDAVKVDSTKGVVTLTGTVAEESHKSLAENTAFIVRAVPSDASSEPRLLKRLFTPSVFVLFVPSVFTTVLLFVSAPFVPVDDVEVTTPPVDVTVLELVEPLVCPLLIVLSVVFVAWF